MKNRSSIFRPIALAFLMALSFGIGIGFLAIGIYEGWRVVKREFLGEKFSGYVPFRHYHNRHLAFSQDGSPVVYDGGTVGYDDHSWNGYTKLDGEKLPLEEERYILQAVWLHAIRNRHRHPFDREPFEGLLSTRHQRFRFRDPANPSLLWRWEPLTDFSRSQLLVARQRRSGDAIAYVSPEGFSTERPSKTDGFVNPRDERREGEKAELVTFLSGGKLIAIDVERQTVRTIAEFEQDKSVWAFVWHSDDAYSFAVQTGDSIRGFSETGKQLFKATGLQSPELYALKDGSVVITHVKSSRQERLSDGSMNYVSNIEASWIDTSGNATRTLDFKNEYKVKVIPSDSRIVNSVDWFMESIGPGLVAPEPVVMSGAVFLIAWANSEMDTGRNRRQYVAEVMDEIRFGIPVSAIVGLVCAIACWRRQVRYHAEWTKTWTVFVFLFGLPAWIAWRVHRRWPPLEIATVSEADFVGPELNGLEIR